MLRHLDFTYAYSFAARAVDAVNGGEDDDFILDVLGSDDGAFVEKARRPGKVTLLHDFIQGINFFDLDYATGHFGVEAGGDFASLIGSAGLEIPAWLDTGEWPDHVRELDALLFQAALLVSDAAFHLLFADRAFLHAFQLHAAQRVAAVDSTRFSDAFRRPGVLRRPTNLPAWLKRAVFHRDRGRCQRCLTDLTGIVTTNEQIRVDHLIPLARSGTNDPSNFQLLCEQCNLQKGVTVGFHPQRVHTYW